MRHGQCASGTAASPVQNTGQCDVGRGGGQMRRSGQAGGGIAGPRISLTGAALLQFTKICMCPIAVTQ